MIYITDNAWPAIMDRDRSAIVTILNNRPITAVLHCAIGEIRISKSCLDAIGDPDYLALMMNVQERKFIIANAREAAKREGTEFNEEVCHKVMQDNYGTVWIRHCRNVFDILRDRMGVPCIPCEALCVFGATADGCMVEFDLG